MMMIIIIIIILVCERFTLYSNRKGTSRDDNKNIRWLVMIGFSGDETTTTGGTGTRIDGRTDDGVFSVRAGKCVMVGDGGAMYG
jgi:hypothetical protein